MKKEAIHKRWYFRLLQIVFAAFFIFFIFLGIWGIFYEDDMPLVGFFWALIVGVVYWAMKKIIYYISRKK